MKKILSRILSLLIAIALVATLCFAAACGKTEPPPEDPPKHEEPEQPPKPDKPDKPEESDKPTPPEVVIDGAEDVTVTQGTYFNPLGGVIAMADGEDVSGSVTMTGFVDTSKAGEYALTYSVTFGGVTATAERTVTVTPNPHIGEERPTPIFTSEEAYNIAKGCSATATHTANGSAGLAFDGKADTRWESDHGENDVSLTVDLGALLPVEGIRIDWEAAYARSYEVLISSDGKTYSAAKDGSGVAISAEDKTVSRNGAGRLVTAYTFAEGTEARYVRLHCTKRDTQYGYSIFELELLGKRGTVLPIERYPVLFDAGSSGSPDYATEDEEQLTVDFGEARQIDGMEISWSDGQSPAEYRILISEDSDFASASEITLDGRNIVSGGVRNATVTARYIRLNMLKRRFTAKGYLINRMTFTYQGAEINRNSFTVTASSERAGHPASGAKDDYNTYWASEYGSDVDELNFADFPAFGVGGGTFAAKKIDLGEVKDVGRVDLYWRGSDGGKGKYYDLQTSEDGQSWKTVFRQTHGDKRVQSVFVYERARYLRVIDYQSPNSLSFMLEGLAVNSQYPEGSGEGKVDYDVTLEFPERESVACGSGSYVRGGTDFPSSRLVAYIDEALRSKPIPSNDWWQGLLVTDKGYNMFTYPLMSRFMTDGFYMTYAGGGYFSGNVPGNGSQTVDTSCRDLRVGYAGMGDAEVRVTDFSDYTISAVMTDSEYVDKMTVFLSEGGLYSYFLFAEPDKATVWSDNLVGVYNLGGETILGGQGDAYEGDCIVLCVRGVGGYEGGMQNQSGAAREYEERYYIVNAPEGTMFIRGESDISVVMQGGNYLSVGALSTVTKVAQSAAKDPNPHGQPNIEEAELMHKHGYAFVVGSHIGYGLDGGTNIVKTDFRVQTMQVRSGFSAEAYTAFLPHQTDKSDAAFGKYAYDSVRGICKTFVGNELTTTDRFYGVVPTFTEPTDNGYGADEMYEQLVMLYNNNGGDKAPKDSNLISGDPYWQGKNLHPMAMAALASDQIGATDLRDSFLDKIEYILADWFTYDGEKDETTGAYFYYDGEWGTLYYKNSEFGAGVNLADHYFTYGYYTLAAGVLCAYRPEFAEKYGDMIELLIRDYMNWERDGDIFPYMRNFDMFAGHGWAGGYADNDSGNNQESAGEALNSWVGAYLYATAVGNEDMREAAIYGFTTELNAVKHYWFDYFGDFPEFYPYGVAGQVYGGSNFYGTFFNGEPLYAYGIHLIPGEEFLTSYGLTDVERSSLETLINNMRAEQGMWNVEDAHKKIYGWQHVFIPIVAIYDPDEALDWYAETLAEQGNVGNTSEQFNVYWLVHGMKSMGARTTDIWAENGASATVYSAGSGADKTYKAVCWNPTSSPVTYTFASEGGVVGSATVPARSLVTADPTAVTEHFGTYADCGTVAAADFAESDGATAEGGAVAFGSGGRAKYLVSCGAAGGYMRITLGGDIASPKLYIDGAEYPLTSTVGGYESEPLVLTFRHTVEITAAGGRLTELYFRRLSLTKADIAGATATANSDNGNEHVIGNIVDGKENTRWESRHGVDDVTAEIALPRTVTIYELRIMWETASAAEYKVYFAGEDKAWREVAHIQSSRGARTDSIMPSSVAPVRYIRIEGLRRTTTYGYSIYEVTAYTLS